MKTLVTLGLGLLLVACGPGKPAPAPEPVVPATPLPVPPTEALFPTPYFPAHGETLLGRAVGEWPPHWTAACVYTETLLDEQQKAFVAGLEPAGGEGKVGTGFTQDFDGDGKKETVSYGAWARQPGEEGNFVLVSREASPPEILLLEEFPGPPRFTVFTLKPDGSLWFGGGIDAGEVTMNITWDQGKPVLGHLTLD